MGKSSKNGESLSQSRSSGSVSFLLLFCSNIFGVEMRNFLPKKPHLLRNLLQQQILAQNSAQDPIFHQLRNLKSHWLKMWVSKSQLTLQKSPDISGFSRLQFWAWILQIPGSLKNLNFPVKIWTEILAKPNIYNKSLCISQEIWKNQKGFQFEFVGNFTQLSIVGRDISQHQDLIKPPTSTQVESIISRSATFESHDVWRHRGWFLKLKQVS